MRLAWATQQDPVSKNQNKTIYKNWYGVGIKIDDQAMGNIPG
jgi:hypothetical protein